MEEGHRHLRKAQGLFLHGWDESEGLGEMGLGALTLQASISVMVPASQRQAECMGPWGSVWAEAEQP